MQFRDVSEHARADDLDAGPGCIRGHALGAHLRRQLLLPGEAGHPPRLVDAPGERLLAVDVLAQLHGRQADRCVHMVGNADDDRVDLPVQRIEHLAVIAESLGLGIALERVGRALLVHVAKRDDVLAGHLAEVLGPLPSAADDGEVQPVVRFRAPGGHGETARTDTRNARRAEVAQHLSAIPAVSHERSSSRL